jgi:hypothetical protein
MGPLSYLGIDRLTLIPERYWAHHEFCFYLHDRLIDAASQYEASGSHLVVEDAVRDLADKHSADIGEVDLFELLKNDDLKPLYKHHIISHTVLALLGDMHQFLFSSLEAFEARRFSVGFSLLRKVFKEHLVFLCWILYDDEDFIACFEGDVYKTLNHLSKEKRMEVFSGAIASIELSEMFDSGIIWSYVFDKNFDAGFEPIWQMAMHLVTSQGIIKTTNYSLNFAFEDRGDDFYYEILYRKMPYLLVFLVQISMRSLAKTCTMDENVLGRVIISTIGTYEALYIKGRSHVAHLLRNFFGQFLYCMYCGKKIRLTKKKRPRLLVSQMIECQACHIDNQFPLEWLLAKANIVVKGNGEIAKSPKQEW